MDVQIAGPPAFFFHVHKALHDQFAVVGVPAANLEVACPDAVFGTTFHLERIPAGPQFEHGFAGHDEMVVPKRQLARSDRLALRVLQMHPHGDRLFGLLVDGANLELAASGGRCRTGREKHAKCLCHRHRQHDPPPPASDTIHTRTPILLLLITLMGENASLNR